MAEDITDLLSERLTNIVGRVNATAVQKQGSFEEIASGDARRCLEQGGMMDICSFFSNAFMFL